MYKINVIILWVKNMKTNCIHCKKDISKEIRSDIEKFKIGNYTCSHCNKPQKRYMSEFDLMLYFLSSSAIYVFCLFIILMIFEFILYTTPFYVWSIAILLTLTVGYILTNLLAAIIYDKAPYKAQWKNFTIKENAEEVVQRMKKQFIILMLIIIILGTQTEMFGLFVFMFAAIIIITAIKTYLCFKYERIYYQENKN